MEPASPARLYAAGAGLLLAVLGIAGFFYSASFGSPGMVEEAFGVLRVNAWLNLLYTALGALGLLLAGTAPRAYARATGALLTVLAVWGFALGGEDAILGFLPVGGGNEALNLTLGLLGLAAATGSSRGSFSSSGAKKEPRGNSEAGAQAAG